MTTSRLLWLLASGSLFLSLTACGGDGGDDDDDDASGTLSVSILSPTEGWVRDETVTVRISTSGAPDQVVLLVDEVERGSFEDEAFAWTTSSFDDGPHTLVAEARRGAESARSNEVTLTVDKVAPRLVDRAPAAGSSTFDLSGDIVAEFDEPVTADDPREAVSLTATAQACPSDVCPDVPLDVEVTFDEDGEALVARLLSLPRSASLPVDLRVRIGNGVTDLAGNPLDTSGMMGSWVFAAPAWFQFGARIDLDSDFTGLEETADGATLTVGPDGTPFVLWTVSSGGVDEVRLYEWQSFWALVGDANDGLNVDVRASDLVVAANGEVFVAIGGDPPGDGGLVEVLRWDGSTFRDLFVRTPLLSDEPAGTEVVNVELAIAPSERAELALLVETLDDELTRRVRVFRYIGTDWVQIGEDVPDAGEGSRLTVDSRDRALVATLLPGIGDDADVQLRRFETSSNAWEATGPRLLHGGGGFALLVDEGDRPYLAVREATVTVLYVLDGGTWQPPPGPGLGGAAPELGMDAEGTIVLATTREAGRWERDGAGFVYGSYGNVVAEEPPQASRGMTLGLSPGGLVLRAASDGRGVIRAYRFNEPVVEPAD